MTMNQEHNIIFIYLLLCHMAAQHIYITNYTNTQEEKRKLKRPKWHMSYSSQMWQINAHQSSSQVDRQFWRQHIIHTSNTHYWIPEILRTQDNPRMEFSSFVSFSVRHSIYLQRSALRSSVERNHSSCLWRLLSRSRYKPPSAIKALYTRRDSDWQTMLSKQSSYF